MDKRPANGVYISSWFLIALFLVEIYNITINTVVKGGKVACIFRKEHYVGNDTSFVCNLLDENCDIHDSL